MQEANPDAKVNVAPEGQCLFINGRFIVHGSTLEISGADTVWTKDGKIAAARLSGQQISAISAGENGTTISDKLSSVTQQEIKGEFIDYPWDLIHHNPDEISNDFAYFNLGGKIQGKVYQNVTLLNEKQIHIAEGASVRPGVVLDAEDGPIFIDKGATVMSNAVLQGPLYLGQKSTIKMGAKIYEGTTIGNVCKVGGEVEESIIHGYSNKQHEGFLGHAYLGEWVNIGADSNNSDLKNNYGPVKLYINGKMVDSGSQFVGLFMGDHSKCGINTMFNTGTVVGAMGNVYGSGYSPKFIPSYTWGGIESSVVYKLEKALETARLVIKRRKLELSKAQENVLRYVFKMTEGERKEFS